MPQKALSPHGSTRVMFRAPSSMAEHVDEEAKRRGVTASALMREILAEALDWSEEDR